MEIHLKMKNEIKLKISPHLMYIVVQLGPWHIVVNHKGGKWRVEAKPKPLLPTPKSKN